MALAAKIAYEEGCTVLSFDGTNAFNSVHRYRLVPAPSQGSPGRAVRH